jgi:hypothetical protein
MLQFTSRLKKEVDAKIEQIERSEISIITKSLDASQIFNDAFNQLKNIHLIIQFSGRGRRNSFLQRN